MSLRKLAEMKNKEVLPGSFKKSMACFKIAKEDCGKVLVLKGEGTERIVSGEEFSTMTPENVVSYKVINEFDVNC